MILNYDQGGTVTVHTDIPYSSVDKASLELSGIAVRGTKADSRGCLVAMFVEAEVKAIVSVPSTTLTLTGRTKDGASFAGSDTVLVMIGNR